MDRKIDKNRLINQRRLLKLRKRDFNPAFKVIDAKTGEADSFYSSSFARKDALEKSRQGQEAFARRRIFLKNNSED